MARLLPTGDFDVDFGTNGNVVRPGDRYSQEIAFQNDGKILLAGTTYDAAPPYRTAISLTRYHPDGSLDTTFGVSGQVIDHANAEGHDHMSTNGLDVATAADGTIIVVGTSKDAEHAPYQQHTVAIAYTSSGARKASFGSGGVFRSQGVSQSRASAIAIQPNGKIILSGVWQGVYPSPLQFSTWRLLPNGQLDATYGEGGQAFLSAATGMDVPQGIAIGPDGRIVVTGQTSRNPRPLPNRFVGDGLDLVLGGLSEERYADWSSGVATGPHETDPGAFIPLNDDFDEADPADTDPESALETEEARPDDDELVHASLVFTGSHERSGWMLDFPDDKLRVYAQTRASSGDLTLEPIEPGVAQEPPDAAVVNLRIETIRLSSKIELKAFLLPPDATATLAAAAADKAPQDQVNVTTYRFVSSYVGALEVDLMWEQIPGAQSYKILRATEDDPENFS